LRILERTVVKAGQRVSVQVPATSANLGPGFDSLGLALGLYDTVTLETTDDGVFRAHVVGEGSSVLPTDESHLIIRTVRETLESAGFSAPGLRLRAENVIPHGRGLGSSAAAIVSAVLAANALLPAEARLSAAQVLQRCSELEGHPDNVAPALAGRLAISWEEDGAFCSTAVDIDRRSSRWSLFRPMSSPPSWPGTCCPLRCPTLRLQRIRAARRCWCRH